MFLDEDIAAADGAATDAPVDAPMSTDGDSTQEVKTDEAAA